MKLEKWALVAEILGGLAVVLSLILVAVQIARNTSATQVATYQSLSAELNALDMLMAQTPVLATIVQSPYDAERSEEEDRQWFLMNRSAARVFESAFHAYRSGSLNEDQWSRFERNICGMWAKLGDSGQRRFSYNLTRSLTAHLDANCDKVEER